MKLPTKIALFIAGGFGSGFTKHAPGTFGSLALLLCWLLLNFLFQVSTFSYLLILASILVLGTLTTKICLDLEECENSKDHDPSWIVIDEWLGQGIALLPLTNSLSELGSLNFIIYSGLAFLLFRIFDILKPFPVSACEKLPGTFGVMSDDALAGFISAVLLISLIQ